MQVIIKQLYEYFKMEYIVIIITSFFGIWIICISFYNITARGQSVIKSSSHLLFIKCLINSQLICFARIICLHIEQFFFIIKKMKG